MDASSARMLLLAIGIGSLLNAGVVFFIGGMNLSKISLAAEVYAHELVAAGAVDTAKTTAVLAEAGMAFGPNAGKETGLGAFIVRRSDVESVRTLLTISCGWLVACGVTLCVLAFVRLPVQRGSSASS